MLKRKHSLASIIDFVNKGMEAEEYNHNNCGLLIYSKYLFLETIKLAVTEVTHVENKACH